MMKGIEVDENWIVGNCIRGQVACLSFNLKVFETKYDMETIKAG